MALKDDRFWAKVEIGHPCGCWWWTSAKTKDGYGLFHLQGSQRGYAHRVAYEMMLGPIPDGLEIDHLCRNRACVNPDHLEAVTRRENARRGTCGSVNRVREATITHCPQGHAYDDANTYSPPGAPTTRMCRTCGRARAVETSRRRKLARQARKKEQAHALTH